MVTTLVPIYRSHIGSIRIKGVSFCLCTNVIVSRIMLHFAIMQ